MRAEDIKNYLEENFSDSKKTISELSKSDKGKILVEDERKLYDFDEITKSLYPVNTPGSADAIYASYRKVFFVEFKSGFSKRINKNNFDPKRMTCWDDAEKRCKPYEKLFFTNQDNEDKLLRHSIFMKAVESYMTLTNGLAGNSNSSDGLNKVAYYVVVDDPVDNYEDILNTLAQKESETNVRQTIRQSLGRFRKNREKNYYYDEIDVFSPYELKLFLDREYA